MGQPFFFYFNTNLLKMICEKDAFSESKQY